MTGVQASRRELGALAAGVLAAGTVSACRGSAPTAGSPTAWSATPTIDLPAVGGGGARTLVEVLHARRSVRSFTGTQLEIAQLGQLLWAAQGVTHDGDRRSAPSAGALYPLEVYAVTREAVLHYLPVGHRAQRRACTAAWEQVVAATTSDKAVNSAPAAFVITAVPDRTEGKYGSDAARFVALEAGHAAQNLLLQAVDLGLGAVCLGSLDREGVASALAVPPGEVVVYVLPVGYPRHG